MVHSNRACAYAEEETEYGISLSAFTEILTLQKQLQQSQTDLPYPLRQDLLADDPAQ
jgi:hypothetical protein